jgi:uncharacterized protein
MRIEVGYGLEGVLTDAISRDIIERRLKPAFRRQDYEQGIRDGVGAILAALGGEYRVAPPPVTVSEGPGWSFLLPFALPVVFFLAFGAVPAFARRFGKGRPRATRLVFGAVFGAFVGTVTGIVFASVIAGVVIGLVAFVFASFAHTGTTGRGGGSGSGWGSGGGGWSSGGGGFSGGGGSFGGGGASGDW